MYDAIVADRDHFTGPYDRPIGLTLPQAKLTVSIYTCSNYTNNTKYRRFFITFFTRLSGVSIHGTERRNGTNTRNSSADEIANVNFYDDAVYVLRNTKKHWLDLSTYINTSISCSPRN